MSKRDKARLDWLEKRTVVELLWDTGDEAVTRLAMFQLKGHHAALSLRDAVDAAMKQEGRKR